MVRDCKEYLEWVSKASAGDLGTREREELDHHAAGCSCCRAELQRYNDAVSMLRCLEDEPVPRHFFVHPPERFSPWQLFGQLPAGWRLAATGVLASLVFLSVTAVLGVRIESGAGTWSFSVGRGAATGKLDAAALKADILKAADERNRENSMAMIRELRAQFALRNGLSETQQMQIAEALTGLENRVNGRITGAADDLRASTDKANLDLFQTVSLQRQQDMNGVNNRLDRIAAANEAKFRQTDEILETLLQIVTNLKQPGEQK